MSGGLHVGNDNDGRSARGGERARSILGGDDTGVEFDPATERVLQRGSHRWKLEEREAVGHAMKATAQLSVTGTRTSSSIAPSFALRENTSTNAVVPAAMPL